MYPSIQRSIEPATRRHSATKVSELCVFATMEKRYLTKFPPTIRMPPNPSNAFRKVAPKRDSCMSRGIGPVVTDRCKALMNYKGETNLNYSR